MKGRKAEQVLESEHIKSQMQCSGTSILSYRQHESNCILWSCLTILSLLKNQVWVRQDRCDVHIIWLADTGRLVFNFTFCGIFSSYWAICYQVSGEWLLWLYFWNTHHVFSFVWEREREGETGTSTRDNYSVSWWTLGSYLSYWTLLRFEDFLKLTECWHSLL